MSETTSCERFMTPEALRSHFAELTDDALCDVLTKSQDYTSQAVEFARAEAAQRGLLGPTGQSSIARSEPPVVSSNPSAKASRWLGIVGLLSLGNTLLAAFGSNTIFAVGLGLTQLLDMLFAKTSPSLRMFSIAIDVLCASAFLLLQYFARTSRAALRIGVWLYAADALIIFILGWWKGLAVHLILLLLMVRGLTSSAYEPQPDTTGRVSSI